MEITLWIVLALTALALALCIVLERCYTIAFHRQDLPPDIRALGKPWAVFLDRIEPGVRWFESHVTERVTILSRDGLTLHGSLITQPHAKATAILCHGYRSRGYLDFSCALSFYYEQGLDLLVIDQRACGDSEGDTITFGLEERYDVRRWVDWVNARFGERPIVLGGVSLGCATVLMTVGLDLPDNVVGVIGDCGYTSAWEEMAYVIRRDYHIPPLPMLSLLNVMFRHRTGHDLREVNTVQVLEQNTRIPVLLIHGGADRFVPTDFSRENYRACAADKDLLLVESAAHGTAFLADPDAYRTRVTGFLSRVLDGKEPE